MSEWHETDRQARPADTKNRYDLAFVTLERSADLGE